MIARTKDILMEAENGGYAVGAFNFNDLEFLQAIIEAAEKERSPVIVATTEGALKHMGNGDPILGLRVAYSMFEKLARSVKVPVSIHLDHGKHFDVIVSAMKVGYSSVMIDLSDRPFEENLKGTKRIVEIAHTIGVSVEAELGRILGKEDDVVSREEILVDPKEAKIFVEKTGVDFLAPAVGTKHGAFKFEGEAKLDFERLKSVKELTGIPLVLHGASMVPQDWVKIANDYGANIEGAKGVPEDVLKRAIEFGIRKVNIDTDLRISFIASLRKFFKENKKEIDPRKYLGEGRKAVVEVVRERLRILGSSGKANIS